MSSEENQVLINLTNELKRLTRRVDEIAKVQDLLFKDREILEDILTRLSAVEGTLHLNRAHQVEATKDIKAEIRDVENVVENKIDEVAVTMDEKTVIVKSPKTSVFDKIKKRLRG